MYILYIDNIHIYIIYMFYRIYIKARFWPSSLSHQAFCVVLPIPLEYEYYRKFIFELLPVLLRVRKPLQNASSYVRFCICCSLSFSSVFVVLPRLPYLFHFSSIIFFNLPFFNCIIKLTFCSPIHFMFPYLMLLVCPISYCIFYDPVYSHFNRTFPYYKIWRRDEILVPCPTAVLSY